MVCLEDMEWMCCDGRHLPNANAGRQKTCLVVQCSGVCYKQETAASHVHKRAMWYVFVESITYVYVIMKSSHHMPNTQLVLHYAVRDASGRCYAATKPEHLPSASGLPWLTTLGKGSRRPPRGWELALYGRWECVVCSVVQFTV